MDLVDRLRDIASRIPTKLKHVQTEEATKTAMVMPFLNALGYNIFDPAEVVPEFTADIGTKKGEKVDYAILRDGKPIILIECKSCSKNLDDVHASQLSRYFTVTDARFGVLTNGVLYRFFSDLEEPNKMDSRPFLEIDMLDVTDQQASELKKFMKESFDLESILSTASELKFTKGIMKVLQEEWTNPSVELVRLFTGRVYSGRMTQAVREQFTQITKRALHNFVSGKISERLKTALEGEGAVGKGESADAEDETIEADEIVTTEDEYLGFYIVKAILHEVVDVHRIFIRDRKRYCGILLDDNNRKPVCRMWFNAKQKYFGVFDRDKKETKHKIADVDGIYAFASELRKTVQGYGAVVGTAPEDQSGAADSGSLSRKTSSPTDPKVGATLIRKYKGQEIQVTVRPDGYEWDGKVYQSLTAVAFAVTGSRWNGRLFFGLTPKGKAE